MNALWSKDPSSSSRDSRIQEYWDWVAVALYLLITVDMLTSIYAGEVVGLEHEANFLMAWVLDQPLPVLIGTHIVAATLATVGFSLLFGVIQANESRSRKILELTTELYLGLLIAVGLFIFANNFVVVVFQQSLL